MISPDDKRPSADLLRDYQELVKAAYPTQVNSWPLLTGWNIVQASFGGWVVQVFKDAGPVQIRSKPSRPPQA